MFLSDGHFVYLFWFLPCLDDASEAVAIAEAPVLVDANGIPEKTTATENGISYLTGKPLLVLNRENKEPDLDKWFLYYPLFTDSDKQIP